MVVVNVAGGGGYWLLSGNLYLQLDPAAFAGLPLRLTAPGTMWNVDAGMHQALVGASSNKGQ